LKIATKLKDSNFVKSLSTPIKSLMVVPDFLENKLDSDTKIFAFKDCLYDLKTCAVRLTTPEDDVFTTTGYDYIHTPDENIVSDIYKFLRDIQNDEENYKYNLDVMTSCLIRRNIFQEMYFKTGSGANGKSTEQNLYTQSFGKYCACPNAEVLTKPSKGANETSELHNTKGKRALFLQEPDASDKLVTSRVKKLTGGDKLCVLITTNQKGAFFKVTKDIKVNYKYGFDLIVYDYLSFCKEDEIPTSFDYDIDNSAIFKKEDEWFADDWYLIHEADPTVELLCPKCSLDFSTTHIIIT